MAHNYNLTGITGKPTDAQINNFIGKYTYVFPNKYTVVGSSEVRLSIFGSNNPITFDYKKDTDEFIVYGKDVYMLAYTGSLSSDSPFSGSRISSDISKRTFFTTELGEPNTANIAFTGVGTKSDVIPYGWKRYDINRTTAKYSTNNWAQGSPTGTFYGERQFYTNEGNASCSFNFIGSKVRIIQRTYSDNRTAKITIDNIDSGTYKILNNEFLVMVYEKTGLEYGMHTVSIEWVNDNTASNSPDAIDIDSTGRLLHPDEVTDPKDLAVGKRIRCNYKATNNTVGVFSGLGEETSDFIPPASSATPNGDFYYICTDIVNGKIIGVADRNVQHSISWDTLNSEGIASGSGATIPILTETKIPLMTSNTSPKGVVESSGYTSPYEPWRAFSREHLTVDGQWLVSNSTGWISYAFEVEEVINAYSMVLGGQQSYVTRMPKRWLFQAWDETLNGWITLDEKSVLNSADWELYLPKVFTFSNTKKYRKYRLNVLENHGATQLRVFDLRMYHLDKHLATTRLLTGGVTSSDKDNEWDNYIVNSTLNGTITAGDNNVWNLIIASMTSTTLSTNAAQRVGRGWGGSSSYRGNNITSNSDINNGFRPVLEIESIEPPIHNKYLIHDGENIKAFLGNSWSILGSAPVTKEMFKQGMDDSILQSLSRSVRSVKMVASLSNETETFGKIFKYEVDLNKFKDIRTINIEVN